MPFPIPRQQPTSATAICALVEGIEIAQKAVHDAEVTLRFASDILHFARSELSLLQQQQDQQSFRPSGSTTSAELPQPHPNSRSSDRGTHSSPSSAGTQKLLRKSSSFPTLNTERPSTGNQLHLVDASFQSGTTQHLAEALPQFPPAPTGLTAPKTPEPLIRPQSLASPGLSADVRPASYASGISSVWNAVFESPKRAELHHASPRHVDLLRPVPKRPHEQAPSLPESPHRRVVSATSLIQKFYQPRLALARDSLLHTDSEGSSEEGLPNSLPSKLPVPIPPPPPPPPPPRTSPVLRQPQELSDAEQSLPDEVSVKRSKSRLDPSKEEAVRSWARAVCHPAPGPVTQRPILDDNKAPMAVPKPATTSPKSGIKPLLTAAALPLPTKSLTPFKTLDPSASQRIARLGQSRQTIEPIPPYRAQVALDTPPDEKPTSVRSAHTKPGSISENSREVAKHAPRLNFNAAAQKVKAFGSSARKLTLQTSSLKRSTSLANKASSPRPRLGRSGSLSSSPQGTACSWSVLDLVREETAASDVLHEIINGSAPSSVFSEEESDGADAVAEDAQAHYFTGSPTGAIPQGRRAHPRSEDGRSSSPTTPGSNRTMTLRGMLTPTLTTPATSADPAAVSGTSASPNGPIEETIEHLVTRYTQTRSQRNSALSSHRDHAASTTTPPAPPLVPDPPFPPNYVDLDR